MGTVSGKYLQRRRPKKTGSTSYRYRRAVLGKGEDPRSGHEGIPENSSSEETLAKTLIRDWRQGRGRESGGRTIFLGSAAAAEERTRLDSEQLSRISAFSDKGKSVSVLLVDNRLAGIIAMRDEPRLDAKEGLDALKERGDRNDHVDR